MKKFLAGLIIGLVLATSTLAFAAPKTIKLIVNGKEIKFDVPPQIINGRTMVPARPLAEALGAKVDWDDKNWTVVVTSNNQVSQPQTYKKGETVQLDDNLQVIIHDVFYSEYPSSEIEGRHWIMSNEDFKMAVFDIEYININPSSSVNITQLPHAKDSVIGKTEPRVYNIVYTYSPIYAQQNGIGLNNEEFILPPNSKKRFKIDLGVRRNLIPLTDILVAKKEIKL